MKPQSPTRARGVRLGRVLALALALLFGLWLAQAVLIAATAAEPLLQMAPAAAPPERTLSGARGAASAAIDVGHGVTLPNPASYYAVTRIAIEEKDRQPCVLTLWGRMVDPRYAGQTARELARFELGACRGLSGWIDRAAAGFPSHRFLRALRVCGGDARAPAAGYSSPIWPIKGLMVRPATVAGARGDAEPLPDLASFTRPECPKRLAPAAFAAGWTGWSACPTGQLVTGLRAHFYAERYLTGLGVRCRPLLWGAAERAPVRDAAGY